MVVTPWEYWSLGYSVEMTENSSKFQGNTKVTPTQPTAHLDHAKMQGDSFLHFQNEGTSVEKHSHSTKQSITKDQLQGVPLMKQDILEVYSDVFTRIGKLPSAPYKFQLKPNVKPTRHAPRCIPIHLQEAFHQEIQNLERLGILEPVKEVTEWVNSFVIMEKKVPVDSSNAHSPGHSVQKKLQICLDPRDLNEALGMRTILHQKYWGNTWKIPQYDLVHYCQLQQGVLDGGITSRFQEIDSNGTRYWKIPVDQTSNGFHCCTGCFPKETWCDFLECTRFTGIADYMIIYRKNQSWTWWKPPELFGSMQKEQSDTKSR